MLSLVGARLNGQTYTAPPRWERTQVSSETSHLRGAKVDLTLSDLVVFLEPPAKAGLSQFLEMVG